MADADISSWWGDCGVWVYFTRYFIKRQFESFQTCDRFMSFIYTFKVIKNELRCSPCAPDMSPGMSGTVGGLQCPQARFVEPESFTGWVDILEKCSSNWLRLSMWTTHSAYGGAIAKDRLVEPCPGTPQNTTQCMFLAQPIRCGMESGVSLG